VRAPRRKRTGAPPVMPTATSLEGANERVSTRAAVERQCQAVRAFDADRAEGPYRGAAKRGRKPSDTDGRPGCAIRPGNARGCQLRNAVLAWTEPGPPNRHVHPDGRLGCVLDLTPNAELSIQADLLQSRFRSLASSASGDLGCVITPPALIDRNSPAQRATGSIGRRRHLLTNRCRGPNPEAPLRLQSRSYRPSPQESGLVSPGGTR
jgi:hypothetical protein